MRIVEQINHSTFRIVLYTTQTHYIVELEAGPMRQAYKYDKDKFPDVPSVKKTLTQEWLEELRVIFNDMYTRWSAASN
ncbi:MAG: hypothetical protein P8I92_06670 [Schleiferiaceae bacterium]|jgi:hypothetical protein|nr:hypothetical protein [Schleiferiaceae bacterium]|tara:strand:+ start:1911 stop:2144 length:234 start_codon:yes stop_codon:yes gene_type:complete